MKIYIQVTSGFLTDPKGDCCGMRAYVEHLKANEFAGLEVDADYFAWDENPVNAYPQTVDGMCQYKKDLIDCEKADVVICLGHSFGGAETVHFLNWLSTHAPEIRVDYTVLFDPVKNPVKFGASEQHNMWSISVRTAPIIYIPYQRNGGCFGIVGTPLAAPVGSNRINELHNECEHVDWLGKIGIPGAPQVWSRTTELMLVAIQAPTPNFASPAPVPLPSPAQAQNTGGA